MYSVLLIVATVQADTISINNTLLVCIIAVLLVVWTLPGDIPLGTATNFL